MKQKQIETVKSTFFEEILKGNTIKFAPKKTTKFFMEQRIITPLEAKHILKYYNNSNRKPSKVVATKYATDMISGNWMSNFQPISFDSDGMVIDGQHRLYAILMTGISQNVIIHYGLSPEVFPSIDNGKILTNADILNKMGYDPTNTAILAALIRSIIAYNTNGNYDSKNFKGVNQITKCQVMDYLEENTDVYDYVEPYKKSSVVSSSVAAFCYWLLSSVDRKEASNYLDMVFMGYNLTPNTIHHYLYDKLQRNKNAHQNKMTKLAIICNVILGWRRHMGYSQSKSMQLNWDVRKGFPKITK